MTGYNQEFLKTIAERIDENVDFIDVEGVHTGIVFLTVDDVVDDIDELVWAINERLPDDCGYVAERVEYTEDYSIRLVHEQIREAEAETIERLNYWLEEYDVC